ncbi:MAG TPA: LLM class flavin-dependent oxidoreductase [Candidatus Binatia bacterium]|nr:LLM class flavin-dependent oxidoreductase [Candidatus Binatia bacterium]
MKIDLLLIPMGTRYADVRAAALEAETAGFDGVWTWDHLRDTDGDGGPGTVEAWTTLTGLAEATRRVALGPLVLNVHNRHPGLLANMAATLQQVSSGRLLLGIGAGGNRGTPYAAEQEMLGLAVEADAARAARTAEAIQVMRRLWAGDASAFAGAHYRLARPAGYLRAEPPPPVIVGGFGPRMAAIAGRHGDGFNTQAGHPRLADLARIALDEYARAGGDPARFLLTVFAGLHDRWLRPDSAARASLARVGVGRLILLVGPPFPLDQIRAAAPLLDSKPS